MIVALLGAAGMYAFENEVPVESGLHNYGTALWWTAMLITTMGSEYWPKTPEGRVLCFFLALYASAVFGYLTATLATFFISRDADDDEAEIADHLVHAALEVGQLLPAADDLVIAEGPAERERLEPGDEIRGGERQRERVRPGRLLLGRQRSRGENGSESGSQGGPPHPHPAMSRSRDKRCGRGRRRGSAAKRGLHLLPEPRDCYAGSARGR